jgi:dTDP-glucose 4,6-dehydratase
MVSTFVESIAPDCEEIVKVLVTGGAGFIGSSFVEMALSKEFPLISKIVVLDKLTYAGSKSNLVNVFDNPNFEFIKGDICDSKLVFDTMEGIDAVINFAAESHVDRSIIDSTEFIKTNVLGTQVLLDAAKLHNVKKFVQVSTDEVYGSILEGSWDENQPLLPNSPYSASKAAADLLARAYFVTYGLDINITRCSNNFGPRQNPEKLIPNFVLKLMNDEKVPVFGDGKNVRDWLYVEDHCKGIYLVLTMGVSGEIYNIGGGTELTNLELTQKLLELTQKNQSYIEFVMDRPGHDKRYSVDYQKIQNLGYYPDTKFDENLESTVYWYMTQYKSKLK